MSENVSELTGIIGIRCFRNLTHSPKIDATDYEKVSYGISANDTLSETRCRTETRNRHASGVTHGAHIGYVRVATGCPRIRNGNPSAEPVTGANSA